MAHNCFQCSIKKKLLLVHLPQAQILRQIWLKHHYNISLIAAAVNLLRLDDFLAEEKMEKTRISHFVALAPKKVACFGSQQFANGINF